MMGTRKINMASELAALAKMTSGELRDRYADPYGEPSRSGNKRYRYYVCIHAQKRGTDDEAAALSSLNSAAPAVFNGLVRQPVTVEPVYVDSSNADKCIWTGTANYSPWQPADPPQTGDSVFNFDTGGGSQHVTQSLSTISKHAASGTPPDFKGAVGVTHDNVEGVDTCPSTTSPRRTIWPTRSSRPPARGHCSPDRQGQRWLVQGLCRRGGAVPGRIGLEARRG